MFKKLIATGIILACTSCTAKPYLEGGLMIHNRKAAYPEVRFPSRNLGYIEGGIKYKGFDLFMRHTSDPTTTDEQGHGINSIGISRRVYFK